jgi:cytochrome P450
VGTGNVRTDAGVSDELLHAPAPPDGFDLVGQAFLDNPRDWFRLARDQTPVFYSPQFGFWGLTRYEDVERALRDWETFSSASIAAVPVPDQFADRVPPGFFATGALISQDPPKHTARRKLINKGFARSRMASMVEPIERICNDLIDQFVDRGSCDLMGEYCYEVSLRSIVHLMGLPTDDLPLLRQLADDQGAVVSDVIKPMEEAERNERWERIVRARDYLTEVAQARRLQPGDDMVSTMMTAEGEDGNPALTAEQAVTHLTELIFAGTDTTANLMAFLVRLLDENQDQLRELKADPELWGRAVEEGLRVRSATNGLFRVTTRDAEVAGVTIPAGSVVWLGVASAGLDERVFDEPERFDIHRPNVSDHISFGKGRHFCIGSPLTRVEAPIGMRVLYERIPEIHVVAGQKIEYDPVLVAVITKRLLVEW